MRGGISISGCCIRSPRATHPLSLQVVPHLLVFTFAQFLVAILIVFSEDGLNLCIRVAFPESIERTEVSLSQHWITRMQEWGHSMF